MIRLAAVIFFSAFLMAGAAAGQGFQIPSGAPPQAAPEIETPQDESTIELAMKYYERCYAGLYKDHDDVARNDFCACSADLARKDLSARDLRLLATGDAKINAEEDMVKTYKKMDYAVQGPCLHFLVRADEYAECITHPKFRPLFYTQAAYEAACQCLSDGIGDFIEEFGKDMLAAAFERRPGIADPLQAVQDWPDYRRDMSDLRQECLGKYYHQ